MGDGIDWKARAEAAEALIATLQEAAGARIAEHMSHATQGTWQPTEDGTRSGRTIGRDRVEPDAAPPAWCPLRRSP